MVPNGSENQNTPILHKHTDILELQSRLFQVSFPCILSKKSPAYFEYDNTWSGLEKKGLFPDRYHDAFSFLSFSFLFFSFPLLFFTLLYFSFLYLFFSFLFFSFLFLPTQSHPLPEIGERA